MINHYTLRQKSSKLFICGNYKGNILLCRHEWLFCKHELEEVINKSYKELKSLGFSDFYVEYRNPDIMYSNQENIFLNIISEIEQEVIFDKLMSV